MLQQQSWIEAIETMWPAKSKIFTLLPFTEKLSGPYSNSSEGRGEPPNFMAKLVIVEGFSSEEVIHSAAKISRFLECRCFSKKELGAICLPPVNDVFT